MRTHKAAGMEGEAVLGGRARRAGWLGCILLAGGLLGTAERSLAAAGYPFVDGFESGSVNPALWSKSGTGDSVASMSAKFLGNYGVSVINNRLTLDVDENSAKGENCWVFMYARLAPYDDSVSEPDPGMDAGAFYVNTSGQLKARSGLTWEPVGSVPTGQWLCFAMHINYSGAGTWDLYINTNPGTAATQLTKANGAALSFNSGYTGNSKLNSVILDTGSEALMDEVALAASASAPMGNANLAVLALPANAKTPFHIPGFRYTYGAENHLDNLLGDDLGGALVDGERVHVATAGGFRPFLRTAGGWTDEDGVGFANVPVSRTTALVADRQGTMNTYGFFPYDTETAIPAAGSEGNPQITGNDNDVTKGYNNLAWPRAARSATLDFGFVKADGDLLYIFSGNTVKILNWNAGKGYWREGATRSTATLSKGQTFWYYRNDTGTANWNVDGL